MAFVNRAARTINLSRKESNDVGPGHYFNEGATIPEMSNNAPFNSSTSRPNYYKNTDTSLGPGSYETSTSLFEVPHNIKSINQNLYKAVESSVLPPFVLKSIEDSQKIAFSTKAKRFNETKQQMEDKNSPGPGHYKIATSHYIKNMKKKNKSHNTSNTSKHQSISTIPPKEMYGYDFKDGVPVLIPNPYIFERQERADQYDLSPKWDKNTICWNKMSMNNNSQWILNGNSNTNETESKNASSTHLTTSNDQIKHNRTYSDNQRTEASSRSIVFKTIMDKRNSLYQHNNSNNSAVKSNANDTIANFVFNTSPGPGYYYTQENNSQNIEGSLLKRPKLQSFGSTSPRFGYTKSYNDNAYYNNTAYPYIDTKKQKKEMFGPKKEHLFTEEDAARKKETFLSKALLKEKTDNDVGPGSYNLSKSLIKKLNSSVGQFGSKESRFNLKEIEDSPGPGSYINPCETEANKSNDQFGKLTKMISSQPSSMSKEILDKINTKKENPPIGLYNPSIVTSINYKVLSNINQFQNNKKVAFSHQEKRFNDLSQKNSSSTLGPGLYFRFNQSHKDQIKNNPVPFNHNSQRFNYKITDLQYPSPGSYEVSSFHDWNKKTHNILFI